MDFEHYYEVNLRWDSDRKGTMSSPVLNNIIEVATPPEFPKGMVGIWSPEHLFVASVCSCFMTTFLAIAENSKLEFVSLDICAKGKLEIVQTKYVISEIIIFPRLVIKNENDYDKAMRILQKSESSCLITNSIKSRIILDVNITCKEKVA